MYDELVREFLATYHLDVGTARNDVGATSVYFRLGGENRSCSILELGWRLGLYNQHEATQGVFMATLSHGENIKNDMRSAQFWPTIGDGLYANGVTGASAIRDPRVKLAHRCISFTISGRDSSQHRITFFDLFFLYTIYSEDVFCNIPFWVASFLQGEIGEKDNDLIYGGMFITKLARSYRVLTPEIRDYLSEGVCRVVRVRSLKQMRIVMDLGGGTTLGGDLGMLRLVVTMTMMMMRGCTTAAA